MRVHTRPLPGGRRTRALLYETAQRAETTAVIRDDATWRAFWKRAVDDFNGGPDIPAPAVDFGREMLLLAGAGTGLWERDLSIRVDGSRPDSLVATVHLRTGIPMCRHDAFRAPLEVVRVPRDPRPVAFRWEVEDLRCGHAT